MNKLNFALSIGLLAVVLAPYWWEDFPSMAVLYALMTASSVLYGLGCLRGPGNAYLWQQRKVPEAVQRLWARRMGVTPTGVKITSARKRYGSCSGKNSLCFSCFLMNCPEAAIDLVVVHELCHIRVKNHGPAFYALLERYLPDYRERKKLLR